ncbi:hypothetical protein F5B22DRAFT_218710 [Xylaria bambusicola]|uniref:uncharacterized protein n=1 Tax=Xylaria bambusicola TaxID=326684 RepID=UPI0020073BA0|nr:uncharacterized protein F5B22DRAFT_218710 [Xylaria bambusicola]KAI0514822.1 hypothetical protein F5B22DRAFT_218710 [Xylaria bambusicola]
MTMRFREQVLTFFAFATVAAGWRNTVAFEFARPGCDGSISKAWIGTNHQQIKLKNTTQSVYITTVNDGIWRWYGFPASTEDGTSCYGDPVGRLHWPCFDVNGYVSEGKPKVECIRLCSMWAGKEHSYSCAAIGITE